MTERLSVRAAAREIYAGLAGGLPNAITPTPDPSPLLARASGGGEKNDLTAKARALYEGSAVPVAEIARLCGVTDRTIYKYAAKQNWKPRYRWNADGGRPAAFAPSKGAGGRFIRRDDKGKPVAQGLKATDAAGRARAVSSCAKAARLARAAQAEAEQEKRADNVLAAIKLVNRAADKLINYRDACRKNPGAARADDPLLHAYQVSFDAAMGAWQAAQAERDAAEAGRLQVPTAARAGR